MLIPNFSSDGKAFSGRLRIVKLYAWSPLIKTTNPLSVFPVFPKLGTYKYFNFLWMLGIAQVQHTKLLTLDSDEETSHTKYIQACKLGQYRSMKLSTD